MKKKKPSFNSPPAWEESANRIADALDADVMLFAGGIYPPADIIFLHKIPDRRRKNLFLLLATYGGSGDSAYRIAHACQQKYEDGEFILFVPMMCKSAGTLIAAGSHQIIMADTAELGPLDVQITKVDEVGERYSGLTPSQTLDTLKKEAFNLFEDAFLKLREKLRFPTKMAASTAAQLAVGLLEPVYGQIDPMRLGEIERAMLVAAEYGDRIKTENLKNESLGKLLTGYPSHGFVIDRDEAKTLFSDVREPTPDEFGLFYASVDEIREGLEGSARILLLSRMLQAPAENSMEGDQNDHSAAHESSSTGSGSESSGTAGEAEAAQLGEHPEEGSVPLSDAL